MPGKSHPRAAAVRNTKANYDIFHTPSGKPKKTPSQKNMENSQESPPPDHSMKDKQTEETSEEKGETQQTKVGEETFSTSPALSPNPMLDSYIQAGQNTPHSTPNETATHDEQPSSKEMVDILNNQCENDTVTNKPSLTQSNQNGIDIEKLTVPPPILGTQHQFSFAKNVGTSASDTGINYNPPSDVDPNKAVMNLILEHTKALEERQNVQEAIEEPKEVEIQDMKSEHILMSANTPFIRETALPPFENGSAALHYYITLRGIVDKCIRAKLSTQFIEECLTKRVIPRGFRINKQPMAVNPSPQLKLDYYRISANAAL